MNFIPLLQCQLPCSFTKTRRERNVSANSWVMSYPCTWIVEYLLLFSIKAESLASGWIFYLKGTNRSGLNMLYVWFILFVIFILQDWRHCRIHHSRGLAQHCSSHCQWGLTRRPGSLLETLSVPPSSTILSERHTVRLWMILRMWSK